MPSALAVLPNNSNSGAVATAAATAAATSATVAPPKSPGKNPIVQQEAFRNYLNHALEQLSQSSNAEPLTLVVSQLVASKDYAQIQILLGILSCHISRLDTVNCTTVIKTILALDWTKHRHGPFMNAYVRFMTVLVSGIPRWWSDVADKVVKDFVYSHCNAHHSMLEHVMRIIPTAIPSLHKTLTRHFPHKADTAKRTINYAKNMLRLSSYCPELQRSVWGLLFERLVQLDVELFDDDEDEDDEEELEDYDMADEYMGDDDFDEDDKDDEDEEDEAADDEENEEDMENEDELQGEDEYLEELNLKLHKNLDQLLCLVLSHLDSLDDEALGRLFPILIDQFQNYILPTHLTRSAQFVLFHVCERDPELTDQFLIRLIELALASDESPERRQKSMQYISSFVARFKPLSRPQIVFIVSFLAQWVGRYINEREIEVDLYSGGSMGRFRMFYAVAQALFYIFCFRHPLLRVQAPEGEPMSEIDSRWETDLDLLFQRMIVTKFNPLRYCKQTVVSMFAQVAQRESAAYCYTMLKQNKSGVSRDSSNSSTAWIKSHDFMALEGYFPFDPLTLKRAKGFVKKAYVEWSDGDDEDDDETSDEDEDSASEGSEDDEDMLEDDDE